MTKEEIALQSLLLDDEWPSCLNKWLTGVNILDVLKISRAEIRHSNVLAWLLDPSESHGFGVAFLDRFVKKVCQNSDCGTDTSILAASFDRAVVFREWGNEKRRLDILISCQDSYDNSLAIAIENKIDSKDGKDQLDTYYKEVLKYTRGQHLFVYLTPNGDDPEHANVNNPVWVRLSYADIVEILDELMLIEIPRPFNVTSLLNDYATLIRREIMTDSELEGLCNKVYKKHKEAFDLVFKNADMSGAIGEAKTAIKEWLKNQFGGDDGTFIYTGDRKGIQPKLSLQSKVMNKCLKSLPEGINGSWANQDVYYYWFDINKYTGKVRLIVEFGPGKKEMTDEDSLVKMGKIINAKKSLQGGVYRRLKSYAVDTIGDEFDKDKFIPKIEATLAKLQKDETKWLADFAKRKGK